MTAGPTVEHFQPLKNVLLGLRSCPIPAMVDELRFQGMKEAFHDGIVPTIAATTHTDRDAVAREPRAVRSGGVLRPAVSVMPQAFSGLWMHQRPGQPSWANASVSRWPIAQAMTRGE